MTSLWRHQKSTQFFFKFFFAYPVLNSSKRIARKLTRSFHTLLKQKTPPIGIRVRFMRVCDTSYNSMSDFGLLISLNSGIKDAFHPLNYQTRSNSFLRCRSEFPTIQRLYSNQIKVQCLYCTTIGLGEVCAQAEILNDF